MRSPLDIPPTNVLPFSQEVAEIFLMQRLKGTSITFTLAEIDELLDHSGRHPAKLQRAAADLFNRKRDLA
jgi:DNA-binding transcriptional MerR regulator